MAFDPNWANVVLLLHCDGADASTTFTDVSPVGRTMTAVNNAQVDTAQSVFGGASALFDGTNDSITTPDSTSLDLSAANSDQFTIECWIRPAANTGFRHIIGQYNTSTGFSCLIQMDAANLNFTFDPGSGGVGITGTGSGLTTGAWHHIAVSKNSSGKIRLFIDGVMVGSSTPSNSVIRTDRTVVWSLGLTSNNANDYNGHIDEVRITKGVCRYDSDSGFTVPTAAFPETDVGITDVTPNNGDEAGGTAVTIAGAGFTGATQVLFDGVAATSFVVVDNFSITCVTPAGTVGFADVVVDRPTTDLTLLAGFEYTSSIAPTFTSMTPTVGPVAGGTALTITGTDLTGATGAELNGISLGSFTVVNPTTITGTAPASAIDGLVDLDIFHPLGDVFEADAYEYTNTARVTQLPLLVLDLSEQEVRVTQLPLLVLNLPIQGARATQLPILSVYTPTPIPLPAPIVPEVPVIETWQYLTVVNIAEGSKEQRSCLRAEPRIQLSFNAIIKTEAERRLVYQMLFKYIDRVFDYPNYVHSTKLTAAAIAGATKLFFDPASTDMRPGESMALFNPTLELTTYVTITTLDADGANLSTGLLFDVPASWLVCPAFHFRTSPIVGFQMRAIDGNFSLKLESTAIRTLERPGASPTLTTLGGMLLLTNRPLADDDVEEMFDKDVAWLDNKIAAPEPKTNWFAPFISGKRQYLLHRPTDMDYWRGVADTLKGRQNPFLLPTFRDDLPLSAVPALSATHIITSNVQYFDFWRAKTYRYLRIVTANGVIFRRVLEALANYTADGQPVSVDIKLDSALGAVAGDNIISMVSYVNICRLDSDEISLAHGPVDTVLTLAIRAINE